jgi:glycosyltransferase involved in cell wall biosynthesis
MINPLISIIIPVYNSEQYISDTIVSCIEQTYENIEIIIINDGSTDNVEEVIKGFSDPRIHYYKKENEGACVARNFGISVSKGKLLQFLDHDDILDKNKLFQQVLSYLKFGDDYIYSSKMGTVSGVKKEVETNYEIYETSFTPLKYFETLFNQFGKYITTGAWLVTEKLVKTTHGWDANAGLNDDGEFFMRLILNSNGIRFSSESIFYFRRDVPNSFSKKRNSKDVYIKWLYSYSSYVKYFKLKLPEVTYRKLGRKALSVYYCCTFPNYPDLLLECESQIKSLGYRGPSAYGGNKFMLISKILGVKNTLRLWSIKSLVFPFLIVIICLFNILKY